MKEKRIEQNVKENAGSVLKKIPIYKKIGFKISIFFTCAILFAGSFAVIYMTHTSRQIVEHANEQRTHAALKTMRSVLDDYKINSKRAVDNLAQNGGFIGAMESGDANQVKTAADALVKTMLLDVDFVTITDSKGTVIARTDSEKAGDSLIKQQDVSAALQGKVETDINTDTEMKFCVRTGAPIKDATGKIIGAVSAGYSMVDNDFVDKMKDLTDNECTVFIGDERASTTIISNGKRIVGTKLDPKIAKIVLENHKVYQGEADILGVPYATAYDPILDNSGKAIGICFVGSSIAATDAAMNTATGISALLMLLLWLIVTVILTIYIRKTISTPLATMSQIATELSQGNLDLELLHDSNDELGILARALRATVASLKSYIYDISEKLGQMSRGDMRVKVELDYVGEFIAVRQAIEQISHDLNRTLWSIDSVAEQVSAGADQVSSGAQALSSGATEQAATLQQLTASAASVSGQAEDNAASVQQASKYAMQVGRGVSSGNTHMDRLHDAMQQIGQSAQDISKITKLVEDIAFQTNILSLNAAVEAARAGDAGKGFAVVADEVRNLAVKSAGAAKQTSDLIRGATASVSEAELMAEKTRTLLAAVGEKVNMVVELIKKIEAASNEQAASIQQIDQGLLQVSAVVQTNAATAEESSAASEELAAQAQILLKEVDGFKLSELQSRA